MNVRLGKIEGDTKNTERDIKKKKEPNKTPKKKK
jgi:hypothetical protein